MVYDITRRSSYNHLSSWLSDTRNLTNPGTVSLYLFKWFILYEYEYVMLYLILLIINNYLIPVKKYYRFLVK